MATMRRCLAQLTIAAGGKTEHLWPGLEVNFERELAPGFTVADAVAGREDCFAPVVDVAEGALIDAAPLEPLSAPRARPPRRSPSTLATTEPGVHLPPSHEE